MRQSRNARCASRSAGRTSVICIRPKAFAVFTSAASAWTSTLIKTLGPTVRPAPLAAARIPPKTADNFYASDEWKALRKACLERDHFKCVLCGSPGFIADHIASRRSGGLDHLSNLRSLCRRCDNSLKEKWDGSRRKG